VFSDIMREMLVRESFLRLFIETCGHYTEYICTQQDGQSVFEVCMFFIYNSFTLHLLFGIVACSGTFGVHNFVWTLLCF